MVAFLQTLALILFALSAVGIGITLLLCETLFSSLQKRYPKYYNQLGQPTAIRAVAFPTYDDVSRRLISGRFIILLVFKGIPPNFPTNHKLRTLAEVIRYLYAGTIVIFTATAIFFIYFAYLNIAP